ncbi:MAG TPA: hypothetical protein VEN29_12295 [Casimicrobiaceae bacterium]|nr:hypothetical protein [Casimicrobiaceae bacterium]
MNMLSAAALATALAAALEANAQAPASKPIQPAAQPAAAAPAQAASAQQETKTAKRARRKVPSTADARVCLEFPNDMQIVKCSEKYRWD